MLGASSIAVVKARRRGHMDGVACYCREGTPRTLTKPLCTRHTGPDDVARACSSHNACCMDYFSYAHPHPHEVVTQRIIIARAFGHRTPSRTLATRRTNSSFGYGISVTAKKQLSMTTIAPAAHYSSENYIRT